MLPSVGGTTWLGYLDVHINHPAYKGKGEDKGERGKGEG